MRIKSKIKKLLKAFCKWLLWIYISFLYLPEKNAITVQHVGKKYPVMQCYYSKVKIGGQSMCTCRWIRSITTTIEPTLSVFVHEHANDLDKIISKRHHLCGLVFIRHHALNLKDENFEYNGFSYVSDISLRRNEYICGPDKLLIC